MMCRMSALPIYRTTEPPNYRTTELPNHRPTELPNYRPTELPNYRPHREIVDLRFRDAVHPPEERIRHHGCRDRHQDEDREQRRRNQPSLQPDIEEDELHQAARVHQRRDAERVAVRRP